MITPNDLNNYLTKEQIDRIYDVFVFEDDEEIEAAWYENGQLYVDYNSPDGGNVYQPSMDTPEDQAKLKYIITGQK